jgi:hypothetical protein
MDVHIDTMDTRNRPPLDSDRSAWGECLALPTTTLQLRYPGPGRSCFRRRGDGNLLHVGEWLRCGTQHVGIHTARSLPPMTMVMMPATHGRRGTSYGTSYGSGLTPPARCPTLPAWELDTILSPLTGPWSGQSVAHGMPHRPMIWPPASRGTRRPTAPRGLWPPAPTAESHSNRPPA